MSDEAIAFWVGLLIGLLTLLVFVAYVAPTIDSHNANKFCTEWGYNSSEAWECSMSCDDGRTITVPFEIIPQTAPADLCK